MVDPLPPCGWRALIGGPKPKAADQRRGLAASAEQAQQDWYVDFT